MKTQLTLATGAFFASFGTAWADNCPAVTDSALPIEDAVLYIEDNVPDRDVGVHGFFGDTAWNVLCVFRPDGTKIIDVSPNGQLGELGMAEFFFESNEPPYDDWGFEALKRAFPEGDYMVRASNVDGTILTGSAHFTTVVALAPKILSPETLRDEEGELPVAPFEDTLVRWEPSSGSKDGRDVDVVGYQVILTNKDWEGSGHNFANPKFDVHLSGDQTEVLVPKGFFGPETVYEIEVIAIEDSGNQTIGGVSFFQTGS